jgi:hypothetical protein
LEKQPGRQYIPFGNVGSYFIAEPNTLIRGETNQGSVVAGYRFGGEMIDVSVGAFNGSIELAVRYGGSDDGGAEFLPESQYGAVLNWGFFEYTNRALAYLHDKYENDAQTADTSTAQLAVEF